MASVRAMNDNNGFRITGRMVLFSLIGFFGLIFAANAVLIWLAVSTHTAVVVSSSYMAGLGYLAELAPRQAPSWRHLSV